MNNLINTMETKALYVPPQVIVMRFGTRGLLCQSVPFTGNAGELEDNEFEPL